MACEMCFHTIGHKYLLYSVKCDTCGCVQRQPVDAEYIEFYGSLVHRFRSVQPFYCMKCRTSIVVINWTCRDSGQRLEQQKQDRLVESLFDKVLEKVRVR
jgi:hypothetical protein